MIHMPYLESPWHEGQSNNLVSGHNVNLTFCKTKISLTVYQLRTLMLMLRRPFICCSGWGECCTANSHFFKKLIPMFCFGLTFTGQFLAVGVLCTAECGAAAPQPPTYTHSLLTSDKPWLWAMAADMASCSVRRELPLAENCCLASVRWDFLDGGGPHHLWEKSSMRAGRVLAQHKP